MNPGELRADVPGLQEKSYLNFGAHGPSPRYVVDAASSFLAAHEYESATNDPYEAAFGAYDRVRERIAAFVGADADEIALTESTTDGINRIAGAIDWQPGDVVVRTDLEHPAGVLPWQRLAAEGVEVRVVETHEGRIDPAAFADAVQGAKLACFSAITWTHGTRLPVAELVDIADDAGVFTLVDAVQVPGQREMDVTEWGADAVAAAGHKWLLGPWGAGFLYVDAEAAADLRPESIGYRSVTTPDGPTIEYEPGARRFEIGTTSPAPHVALAEAIDVIREVGLETVEARIERLTDRLKAGIDDDRLLSPREYESGLVSIADETPEATVERLADEDVVVRSLSSPEAVRVSVHAVSTETDVDRFLEALEQD
jgi:selenocysteine lyase/cysteine desulfurase